MWIGLLFVHGFHDKLRHDAPGVIWVHRITAPLPLADVSRSIIRRPAVRQQRPVRSFGR